jgi:drug/metabolite transporter (DMT)-like permease
VLAVALGLGASLAWGVADFLGGVKSRTLELLTVLLVSQGLALLILALAVAARGEAPPGAESLAYAAAAGVAGVGGLAAFYRGLAVGAMAVVAPIGATGAALPVAVGVLTGDRHSAAQAAGVGLALVGVVLASREEAHAQEGQSARVATGVGLALLAALGFGSFFVGMDAASDGDVLWALLVARAASVTLVGALAAIRRPSLSLDSVDARTLLSIGVLDLAANGLFAAAATEGLVSLVAVLSSLYPVVTIVLARQVLGERIRPSQQAGVAGALAGVALIAAG